MKKYFAIIGGGLGTIATAIAVFTIVLSVPITSMAYIHKGEKVEIKSGCGVHLATAIAPIVTPEVGSPKLSSLVLWECKRQHANVSDPGASKCVAVYRPILPLALWKQKVEAVDGTGGFKNWKVIEVNEAEEKVTIQKTFRFNLSSVDMESHESLFDNGCVLKDDGETALSWMETIKFSFFRKEIKTMLPGLPGLDGEFTKDAKVFAQHTYIHTDTILNTAKAAQEGKAEAIVVSAE